MEKRIPYHDDIYKFLTDEEMYEDFKIIPHTGGAMEISFIDVDNEELFRLGTEYGKWKYKEKPETFDLPDKYVDVLKTAISNISKSTHITNESILFEPKGDGYHKLTINPTQGWWLFNVYSEYGKLCAAIDKENQPT